MTARPPLRPATPANLLRVVGLALLAALPVAPSPMPGQESEATARALASWVALDMPVGYETRLAPALVGALPGWEADRWGNLVRTVGEGAPHRVVACALDAPAYAVSQITDEGYLRVHRIGRGPAHPLWDQSFAAQQVRILTPDGPVAGVVAEDNGHFGYQHRNENDIRTADNLWVDVGAESREDVDALGIGLLDHFVLSAQSGMGWVGLTSFVSRNGPVDELVVLGAGGGQAVGEERSVGSIRGRSGQVLADAGLETMTWLSPGVRQAGTQVEYVATAEAERLRDELGRILGIGGAVGSAGDATGSWVRAPARPAFRTTTHDSDLQGVADLLTSMVERPGVPGLEWSVRRLVLESLPGWARERARVDDLGNVWVEMGPERDTTVFMAHLDEVGYWVESISEDGVVALRAQGGTVDLAWEGQTALLHFAPEGAPSTVTGSGDVTTDGLEASSLAARARTPLPGLFLAREDPQERWPDEPMLAWFGMTGEELRALGVTPGMGVTSHKEGLRIGAHRFTARALDDRAGTTALIRALGEIDPEALPSKVIFAWSVHEEGGLIGAAALARRFARGVKRIYSVDTFVSSDTPLESPHFAYAPLGEGPVLRAIENSSISPDAERQRVEETAARAGIDLQMGLTQGGTDGTTFTFYGAPNQGLSWPGRYSHSPGEVLDLRDLDRLSRLIVELARSGG